MVRAATRISHGAGFDSNGDPVTFEIEMGEVIPEEIADDIPGELILERVAEADPRSLSREQLLIMAGFGEEGEGEDAEPEVHEYNEDQLREALSTMNNKDAVRDWWKMIRPDGPELTAAVMRGKRAEVEDWVVTQMLAETED